MRLCYAAVPSPVGMGLSSRFSFLRNCSTAVFSPLKLKSKLSGRYALGKSIAFGISLSSKSVNDRASGISQAKEFGYLVIGLACGIIPGPSEFNVSAVILCDMEAGMASGDDEGEKGKFRGRTFKKYGKQMAFEMVHSYEGNIL